ncbi:MAG: hypothetical protein ACREML_11330 [Vulcanimicrobiaceae bacterium]
MLVSLILAVVLAQAAAPAPSPASTPEPSASASSLREIGHVYSNGACTAIATRANSAISAALRNDQTVVMMVSALRTVDLDTSNRINKINGLKQLEHYAEDVRLSAMQATAQVKRLHDLANESTDPVRKEELKQLADALGGALGRQQKMGRDLQGMLVRIAGRDSAAEIYQTMEQHPDMVPPWNWADVDYHTSVYNKMAVREANWLEIQTPLINGDEAKAADHVVGAVNGC